MQSKKFGSKYVLRLDKGEEIVETLKKFCSENKIKLGSVIGIGAVGNIVLGLFETETKVYHKKFLEGDFEIVPLVGNVTTMKGEIYIHLHLNVGDSQQKSWSGHLNSGIVSATCELIIDSIDGEVDRKFSEEIGLNLLEF